MPREGYMMQKKAAVTRQCPKRALSSAWAIVRILGRSGSYEGLKKMRDADPMNSRMPTFDRRKAAEV